MSKALVINGADFSTNKVETITLINRIPCTGIALNKQSATVGDTETLIATVSPANTTDSIIWSTSDPTVATVDDGVITAANYGSATITATCGTYSATCAVTVQLALKAVKNGLITGEVTQNSLRDFAIVKDGIQNSYVSVGAPEGAYQAVCDKDTGGFTDLYPIPLPAGAKTITVNGTNLAPLFVFYKKDATSTDETAIKVATSAKVLYGEVINSGTDWSIPSWTYNSRMITIPAVSGIDSFTIGLYAKSGSSAYNDFDADDPYASISIVFGFENPST